MAPETPSWLDTANAVIFVTFVSILITIAVLLVVRVARYLRIGEGPPLLLWRDVLDKVGLAVPFAGILYFRSQGVIPQIQDWGPIWVIGSGTLAIGGLAAYLIIELFFIERGRAEDRNGSARPPAELLDRADDEQ